MASHFKQPEDNGRRGRHSAPARRVAAAVRLETRPPPSAERGAEAPVAGTGAWTSVWLVVAWRAVASPLPKWDPRVLGVLPSGVAIVTFQICLASSQDCRNREAATMSTLPRMPLSERPCSLRIRFASLEERRSSANSSGSPQFSAIC